MIKREQHRQSGFTLAELMVGMTIGLIVLSGVSSAYLASSRSGREAQASSEQVENGRQAIEYIINDLHHAAYFGQLGTLPAPGAALPDPCETADLVAMTDAMGLPVQGYDAPMTSPLTCLSNSDFVPGTDIIVVRRADSQILAPADTPVQGAIYLQANPVEGELQVGNNSAPIGTANAANGSAATIMNRDGITAAPIQRYLVHIYFIAPCAMPAGGGVSCTGAADDDGNPIPTLKRLELSVAGGVAQMEIVPLVAGVENLQIDYGVDDLPTAVDPITGLIGNGAPDCEDTDPGNAANAGVTSGCAAANPGSVAQWGNVVSAQVHVLSRSYRAYNDYTDTKTYDLGEGLSALTPGGNYKRHAYSTAVRLTNVSGRREVPI